jgi:predicted amidophosphoribosyltransferase
VDVKLREIVGNWDRGFVLHKHVLSSVYVGDGPNGRPQFDTTRSEPGEALFQLKYRQDFTKAPLLAVQLHASVAPLLEQVSFIVPMPASTARPRQPVHEIARELGRLMNIPVFENILVKNAAPEGSPQLKNLNSKEEKLAALAGRFSLNEAITNQGRWNALRKGSSFGRTPCL